MGIFNFWQSDQSLSENSLNDIFPFGILKNKFVESDIKSTYSKILTDTVERTHGIPEKVEPLLWDNCVQNEANAGLVSLLAEAMTCQRDLFLVYIPSIGVLREATREEAQKIKSDYEKTGKSSVGTFISFKKYERTEMLSIYSGFEHCLLSSLNKTLNLSKAIQLKMNSLRSSVALLDAQVTQSQAKAIATALGQGHDVLLDSKDEIETAMPDTSSAEKAILFLDSKKAWILSVPLSYLNGEQTGGIGATGEADMRAVERGLKQYFVSILRPSLETIFDISVEFKTQDFRQMTSALEALKTFELVSDETMSHESKQEIIARMFELDLKKEKRLTDKAAKEAEKTQSQNQNPEGGPVRNIGFPR